ncbi:MAG: GNAT family N-acetyltransferase [Planctomycetaceae bacterium]|nr:GNAT family N-acetyltransferase [Planctomycetaceae bacterium]
MAEFEIRTMCAEDRWEVAEMIYTAFNHWYLTHGQPAIFQGGPAATDIFYEVYETLDPGCGIVAENRNTSRLMGSCFYHPRPHHVSLGIMNVHPNHFGTGAGKALLEHIIAIARGRKQPLRLTQSALNLDSFSLYNKAGFVPRYAYQDMFLAVPEAGLGEPLNGHSHVRPANLDDVSAIAELEMTVSHITREQDYRYAIENQHGHWRMCVYESDGRGIDGFLISCGHPAMNIIGPGVARTEDQAAAMIWNELNAYPGRSPVVLIPVQCAALVRTLYAWGARNCELHFCQVLGEFHPFEGVNLPSFLPETG